MEPDWWARWIGITALLLSVAGLGWRMFEWWMAERLSVRVVGTAGAVITTGSGPAMGRGPSFANTHVAVEITNKGKRAITVTNAGFLDLRGGNKMVIIPLPGILPAKLEQGQSVSVIALPQYLKIETMPFDTVSGLMPFCGDAEGRIHKGKFDKNFWRLVADILAVPQVK